MHTAIEIYRPLVAALRMSEALPNTEASGGTLHVLYGEQYRPIGYLVEKTNLDDNWESQDPRFFLTDSHAEAVRLLSVPFAELPVREVAATAG
jgi:hypothetical protein